MISALELLGSAVALRLWGSRVANGRVGIRAFQQTDSMVATYVTDKWGTSAPNVAFALRELVMAAILHNVDVKLKHFPGVKNALADTLSRGFPGVWKMVQEGKRVCVADIPFYQFGVNGVKSCLRDRLLEDST